MVPELVQSGTVRDARQALTGKLHSHRKDRTMAHTIRADSDLTQAARVRDARRKQRRALERIHRITLRTPYWG